MVGEGCKCSGFWSRAHKRAKVGHELKAVLEEYSEQAVEADVGTRELGVSVYGGI